ncbi:hypothetical protein ABES02_17070 [Neobacillus pocheonensis]|uniref:hypothetical protein n=1 Tax=Neobacillus pocheonensis TaxID=363869 RepID=UPI003D288D73
MAKVTTAVSGSTNSNVVDFVGFGSANDSETMCSKNLLVTHSFFLKKENKKPILAVNVKSGYPHSIKIEQAAKSATC